MELTWSEWQRGVDPDGIVYGLLMSVCAFVMRDWDAPVPLVAVLLFAPAFAVTGFRVARGRRVESGLAAGAAAALTGHAVVFLATVIYTAATESWPKAVGWVSFGLAFLLPVAMVGGLFGLAGAALARLVIRSPNG